ncbi:hypothetical protein [Streptomyces sp. NPDC008001]|uniref:hypothetical protein n=1 Tax=Streptomyces sp. NPDC008001 TaxID=3364804 RepID=UPI0036ED614C
MRLHLLALSPAGSVTLGFLPAAAAVPRARALDAGRLPGQAMLVGTPQHPHLLRTRWSR